MWLAAHEAIEEAQTMRQGLQTQVAEMTKRDGSWMRYRNRMLVRILYAAIRCTHADMGSIEICGPDGGRLTIRVRQGSQAPSVDFLNGVHGGSSTGKTAMKTASRIVIEDTANSPLFDNRSVEEMLEAKVRAVQCTPLFAQSGQTVGMLSTQYRTPRGLSANDLHAIDRLAKFAAELIEGQNHRR